MELKDYTTEELRAEIKRRWLLEQEEKKRTQIERITRIYKKL